MYKDLTSIYKEIQTQNFQILNLYMHFCYFYEFSGLDRIQKKPTNFEVQNGIALEFLMVQIWFIRRY